MTLAETYNLVRYGDSPFPQTHPSRLHALGKLAGMRPAAVETCRYLELGASEGVNLIPMAHRFRAAQFTGIDLAPLAVERGVEFASEFGLPNVRLLAMDLLGVDASFGEFDYIVAHGVYSWTPSQVRDKVLAIMGSLLAPQGIGFVSYNTQPVGHIRRMVREMMLFHAQGSKDPTEQLSRAREMLALLARDRTPAELERMDAYDAVLAAHAAELLHNRSEGHLYHDDLETFHEPASLEDFVKHARLHGLRYLDDSGSPDPRGGAIPKGLDALAVARVKAFAGGDRVLELQYYDYLRMRRLRQSLVCRADVSVEPEWEARQVVGLHAATRMDEVSPGTFVLNDEFRMSAPHPVPQAYLRRLIGRWPSSEPVCEADAGVALALFQAGAIELHGAPGAAVRFSSKTSPVADELVRFQAGRGESAVTTLWHEPLETDDTARRLLTLLDGSRDCRALAQQTGETGESVSQHLAALGSQAVLIGRGQIAPAPFRATVQRN